MLIIRLPRRNRDLRRRALRSRGAGRRGAPATQQSKPRHANNTADRGWFHSTTFCARVAITAGSATCPRMTPEGLRIEQPLLVDAVEPGKNAEAPWRIAPRDLHHLSITCFALRTVASDFIGRTAFDSAFE